MRYQVDHDLHIHTWVSGCAGHDPRQTKEAILAYGLTNGFGLLAVADHIWDPKVTPAYVGPNSWSWLTHGPGQDLNLGKELLPLPQSDFCNFLFGIEADMDSKGNLAVSPEEYDNFQFIVISPSHLHLEYFTRDPARAGNSAAEFKELYKERLFQMLDMDLPFYKCGLAHFTCCLDCSDGPIKAFTLFSDEEYREIFALVAQKGMGVELNFEADFKSVEAKEETLRPFRIAKEMGCKFYLGGDAHTPEQFVPRKANFERIVELLDLTEDDKFDFVKEHIAGKKICLD